MYQSGDTCLTCFQAPGSDARSANKPDVMEAVRKHLWFTEGELDQAIICSVCWASIDAFERFYVSVEKLYESRYDAASAPASPESVTVKQEGHQGVMTVEVVVNVDEEPEIKEEIESDQDESDMLLPGDFEGHFEVPPEEEVFKEEFESETVDESMEVEGEADEDPDEVIRKHVVLKCDKCGSDGFDVFKQFTTHAAKVHGFKKPTITCCGNKYQTRSRLLEHVRYVLNPDAFKCNRCDQMFMNGDALKRHLRIHHGVETRTRTYNSENRLRKDKTPLPKTEEQLKKEEDVEKRRVGRLAEDEFMRDHVKFECVPCGETFTCFADLFGHSRSEHKQKPVVVCCGNRYHSRPRLLQHVQSVKNPVAFRCELCFRCFGSEYAKSKHVTEMHATEEELKFRCDRCPKAFVREITWRKHMQDHEDCDNEKIKCGDCGKLFKSHHILYMHVRKKHREPQFVCDICAKAFHMKSEFERHKLEHEDPDQLKMQCQHCLKWFKNREYWRAHVRLHVVGEVKCDLCDRVTPNRRAFRAHMKNAHGARNKKCDWCGKCFSKNLNLREHIASKHTGDMLYTCSFCPKTFNSNANMHSHQKKMHHAEWLATKESAVTATMPVAVAQELKEGGG